MTSIAQATMNATDPIHCAHPEDKKQKEYMQLGMEIIIGNLTREARARIDSIDRELVQHPKGSYSWQECMTRRGEAEWFIVTLGLNAVIEEDL